MLYIILSNHLSNLTKIKLNNAKEIIDTVLLETNKTQLAKLYKHKYLNRKIFMRDQMDTFEWAIMNRKNIKFIFDGKKMGFRENSFHPINHVDNEIFKNVDSTMLDDKYCTIINEAIKKQNHRTALVIGSAHMEHITKYCEDNDISYWLLGDVEL